MPRRKSPESDAVTFFETASLDAAVIVLNICRGIVQRRQGAQKPRARIAPARRPEPPAPSLLPTDVERAS